MDTNRRRGTVFGATVLALAVGVGGAGAAVVVTQALTATAKAPRAKGHTQLVLKSGAKGTFAVVAKHLAPKQPFDVVVNGVKVGTFTTSASGKGRIKFSRPGHAHGALLGFDPQGAYLVIRDHQGDDDLFCGEPPADSATAACCLQSADHDDDAECVRLSAAACAKAGGTPASTASCLPNPCPTSSAGGAFVCCLPESARCAFLDEDPQVECTDDVTEAQCAQAGGTVVQAASCHPSPCAPPPPVTHVACCLPVPHDTACAMLTTESCTAHGGTVASAASCAAHPCGGPGAHEGDGDGGDQGGHGHGPWWGGWHPGGDGATD
ncbi:MAG TPA: hypothetical protein VKW76_00025 [Candidatus Binatia bacterium]|nr:hypothetical protein [Candidatus Binatia bacterium]